MKFHKQIDHFSLNNFNLTDTHISQYKTICHCIHTYDYCIESTQIRWLLSIRSRLIARSKNIRFLLFFTILIKSHTMKTKLNCTELKALTTLFLFTKKN